jgi:release factor glutamine methyltransferase
VIASQAQGYLTATGRVLAEIGWQQGPDVAEIFKSAGWGRVRILPDLDGRDRVLWADTPA